LVEALCYCTSRKVAGSSPDEVDFFHPSSRTMALGSTQPLTEMSARNLPGGNGRPARKADNLTAICEQIVWILWDPQRLTTPWASTAWYRDSFTFLPFTCLSLVQFTISHQLCRTKHDGVALTFYTFIREVLGSNLDRIKYHDRLSLLLLSLSIWMSPNSLTH
jgi:hypothetical protein